MTATIAKPEVLTATKMAYINGKAYEMRAGETILAFLKRHLGENYVPTLCDAPNLEPFGACRVCSVDIARQGNGGPAKPWLPATRPLKKG
jgi:formate dehydrogenase major subunit